MSRAQGNAASDERLRATVKAMLSHCEKLCRGCVMYYNVAKYQRRDACAYAVPESRPAVQRREANMVR